MSMKWLTILQFLEIVAAYGIVTLFLPWLVLRKRFRRFSAAEQLTGYFFAGNFYIIYLVYLLQFLHISSRVTLILGTVGPFLGVWIWKRRSLVPGAIERLLILLERFLSGEKGKKTSLVQLQRTIYERFFRGRRKQWMNVLLEFAVLGAAIAAITYVYGPNMIEAFGYKASDIPVHNYWINELDRNNIWVAGVYPYGFHIVIYYLHVVFGIKTYVLLRIFGVVQTYFVYLALLMALKMICKCRFTPYVGILVYVMDIFTQNTYIRFESALPQEFSMIFILSSVCMAIRFFQEFARMQKVEDGQREEIEKNCRWYLVQFAIGFSLSLTVHFYGTMIAGLFCIGVAVGFSFRFLRWKYFQRIMVTGILSVLLAVLPMALGVAMGKGLQGSLYWAIGVMQDSGDENASQAEESINDISMAGTENSIESVIQSSSAANNTANEPTNEVIENQGQQIQQPREKTSELIKQKLIAIKNWIELYDANEKAHTVIFIFCSIILLFAVGIVYALRKDMDYAGVIWSVAIFMSILCVLQCASILKLPVLMDAGRTSIFFTYSLCMVWGLEADAVLYLLCGWWKKRWILNMASLLALSLGATAVVSQGLLREPVEVNGLEDNGAITCVTNILKENKDFTWTICSANDELRMTEFYGYHYEISTLLSELRDLEQNPEIIIPTKYVYFFIEKIPLAYGESTDHEEVTEEGAETPLPFALGINLYTGQNRWITMSHMYYWAQAFKELYPGELEVYYETDSFICYRLQQNVNSPYNLAIDYGYNNPMPKLENKEE